MAKTFIIVAIVVTTIALGLITEIHCKKPQQKPPDDIYYERNTSCVPKNSGPKGKLFKLNSFTQCRCVEKMWMRCVVRNGDGSTTTESTTTSTEGTSTIAAASAATTSTPTPTTSTETTSAEPTSTSTTSTESTSTETTSTEPTSTSTTSTQTTSTTTSPAMVLKLWNHPT